jgi:hypothetical protein
MAQPITGSRVQKNLILRVLRALRGKISLCMLINDLGMLCCDETEKMNSGLIFNLKLIQ